MQLFYNANITASTHQFFFDSEESRHLVTVLRKSEGDELYVTNGKGGLFTAKIIDANPKNCSLELVDATCKLQRNYELHIAVAPTKTNERFEWFIEKATEIGIHEITPIICKNAERKTLNTERMEKISIAAMKQSLQCYLPKLNAAVSFNHFMRQSFHGQLFIAYCEHNHKELLSRRVLADHKVTILIGPEGDFSKEEIHLALEKGYIPVSLGDTRLRTETAAIVACHTVALINQ